MKCIISYKLYFGLLAYGNKNFDRALKFFEPKDVYGIRSIDFAIFSGQCAYGLQRYKESLDFILLASKKLYETPVVSEHEISWKNYMQNYMQNMFMLLHNELADNPSNFGFDFEGVKLDLIPERTKELFPLPQHPDWRWPPRMRQSNSNKGE